MNHPGSVHTKFYSCDWLIQSIIYSLARASDISRGRGPAKIPRNRPIYPRICPWKSREILLFLREISEALISEGYKGEGDLIWGGGGGGLGKRGFTVFTFDVHFMNVFSLCRICLRQRSTFTYCSILWETNLKAMVIIMWWVSIIHIPGWCLIDRETVQCKNKHLIAGYHHDKQLSQCKRRQYSALLYISIIQVIGPSLHKRRKVLILSQLNRTTLQWARSWRGWSYIVPFHLQQWKIIFIDRGI